jgi:cardiolipin synthase A/B
VIVAEHAGAVSGDGRGEDGHGDRDDHIAAVRRILEGVIGVPATEGNRIDVLRNGDEIFAAMLEAIDEAQHTVDLLTFVYWQGEIGTEFANRLAARARAGVRVRVLLNGWGSSR